ncbi:AI-2E family transporter [Reinekea marinisedimentorum]|uniref:Putative permease n=1 Tax=Reinekea marinisedimentorum TaxID=230495 RepID=A0A4R3I675_9GAMM|nr:AI-2E family transporter [Reinekea marinisedimentorum]TCS40793.1 putative permease [Reinekea marinisedimentorum]
MKFLGVVKDFFTRYFSDEEAIILVLLALLTCILLYMFGSVLAPLFAAIILSYLLSPIVDRLQKFKVPHTLAVVLVFLFFFGTLFIALVTIIPALVKQITALVGDIPQMMRHFQQEIAKLPEKYPEIVSEELVLQWVSSLDLNQVGHQLTGWVPNVVTFSLNTLPSVLGVLVYAVVVPLMVFFILKDREYLWESFKSMLPSRRQLMNRIALEMNQQIANYIRGKFIEILIVGGVSFVTFVLLGLNYAALLAVLVGFSVLIPYIGATVVTIPVFAIGAFQWGFTSEMYGVMVAYLIIQILDGNVLVPLLFSEAVNLHPVAIIVAVIIFGGVWGFWGIFFAIPLATLVKAVVGAWPKHINAEGA